jgi:DNA invertase Pin-like site-specific DNA recombinase
MSSVIGYARVSSTEQDLALQEEALRKAGCTVIRSEKRSGTAIKGRDQLQTILDFIHAGDVLVVTKLDRLARSVADLMRIVELLTDKGASLRVLNAHIDTKSASGKAFLGMLGVFAEFETNLRRERQMEGIAKAKKAGVYKGRPPSIDPEAVRRLKADGIPPSEIAKSLGIGRASVYRVLASKPDAESRKAGFAPLKKPMPKVQRARS